MYKACNYVYDEAVFGVKLYVNGWKKIILHPIDTVKGIGSALWHPVNTVKAVWSQVKEHPVGMIINFGLSWGTGYALGKGIDYGVDYFKTGSDSAHAGASATSIISQIVSQGGCGCNGVCTSVVSATSITNQAATLNEAEPLLNKEEKCGCKKLCKSAESNSIITDQKVSDGEEHLSLSGLVSNEYGSFDHVGDTV